MAKKRPVKKPARKPRPGTGTTVVKVPDGSASDVPPASSTGAVDLPPDHELFLQLYVANGFNASAAYKELHPGVGDATARTNGWRLLTKADIKVRLEQLTTDRWKAVHMSGEEVLARVAMDARADPRALYDDKGQLLKPHEWPDEIANSIEGVELKPDGSVKVKLASKTSARRTILEITGKVKGNDVDELAAALRETLEKTAAKVAGK